MLQHLTFLYQSKHLYLFLISVDFVLQKYCMFHKQGSKKLSTGGEHVYKRTINTFCSGTMHSITYFLSLFPLLEAHCIFISQNAQVFIYVPPEIQVICFLASNCPEC